MKGTKKHIKRGEKVILLLVSVKILTYNHVDTIARALDSVLSKKGLF